MATNSTFREIQDNVMSLISKSDATTRSRVKNWINLGQSDFVLRELWPFREETGSLSLVPGTQEYPLSSSFTGIDDQNILSVTIQGTINKKLVYWPYNQLRADVPDFTLGARDIPQRYYIKSGQLGLYPSPNGSYTLLIDYYKVPTELVDDADESIIPLSYREALMQYALSLEHDWNTDPDLAQKAMNRYEQIITTARQNLLAQPADTGSFRILGPADSVPAWTGLGSEIV
jgi:hypothetical protein